MHKETSSADDGMASTSNLCGQKCALIAFLGTFSEDSKNYKLGCTYSTFSHTFFKKHLMIYPQYVL